MTDPPGHRLLTDTLLGPVRPGAAATLLSAVERIPDALARSAVSRPGGGSFRLTDHDIRCALDRSGVPVRPTPFAWSARTARRALGLAAVRSLVAAEARSPVEGVHAAVDRAINSLQEGQRPVSTMDRWLAGLPSAGRAAVQAEAVTWASRLWSALDWAAFEVPPVIGRDHWWDSPQSSLLALRSRAEVRAIVTDEEGERHSVHLVVLGGPRRDTIRSELSVVAMVEAIRRSDPLLPGRVVGWWPDSGHLVRMEVDQMALDTGVTAVAHTLAHVQAGATPVRSETKAAA